MADGCADKAIARQLGISFATVRYHIRRLSQQIGGPGLPRGRLVRWWFVGPSPQK